tara:strand:+ start:902 stop:1036 length:135 start_codon:yes stop_codon:yes gene_type:complete
LRIRSCFAATGFIREIGKGEEAIVKKRQGWEEKEVPERRRQQKA